MSLGGTTLILPPFRPRVACWNRHALGDFDAVADQRPRATLYHIPQVSGVGVPVAVAASLRKRYGALVAGLKDSSGDFKQFQAFRAAAPELAITVGNETDITRAIAARHPNRRHTRHGRLHVAGAGARQRGR